MRVKSIVLDGFKSYAHRQELADLDSHFNAITGFNGSGKSNVFDAICFVMGISNLKKVRADDTRDLIYRAGAAGVQSARVTIEFINDDPKTAPAGYPPSEYPIITIGRQTQIGGKQRYFFLNRQSDAAKIKHFFHNINLNVDNPHFMVLQGTVHKLIGMKSSDILALVEEAVGTKVFDVRRRTAENLIRSKERKLEEINKNLTHEIGPMLEAMKADQLEYDQFLKANETLEAKRQFRVAFHYWTASQMQEQHTAQRTHCEQEIASAKASLAAVPALTTSHTQHIASIKEKLREPEGRYVKLHEEESDAKKELQRIHVQLQASDRTLQDLQKQEKAHQADRAQAEKQRAAFKKLADQRSKWQEELTACSQAMEQLKESLRLHKSGVVAGLNGVSIEEERSSIESSLIRLNGDRKRLAERVEELQQAAEELRERTKSEVKKNQALQAAVEQNRKRVSTAAQNFKPFEELESKLRTITAEVAQLQSKYHALQTDIEQSADPSLPLALHYSPIPAVPDMERRILGRLGQLVQPKEKKYSLALSVGAQQHLLKVVITDDATAQVLLQEGRLRQRTAFLPLNQVQPARIDPRRYEEAARRAQDVGGFAIKASDLIAITNPDVQPVVEAMFGSFLVCSDLQLAQTLAFDNKINLKAVSIDGQTADPYGLMSGGAVNDSMDIIGRIHRQVAHMAPLTELQQTLRQLEQDRLHVATQFGKGGGAKKDLEDAEDALQRSEEQLKAASSAAAQQLQRTESELEAAEKKIPELQAREEELKQRKAELDKHAALDPRKVEGELETKLLQSTKRYQQLQESLAAGTAEFDKKEADLEQRDAELAAQSTELQRDIENQNRSRDAIVASQRNAEATIQRVLALRKESDAKRLSLEKDLQDAETDLQGLKDRQDGLERSIKEKELEVKQLAKSIDEQKKHMSDLERKHTWLRDERQHFGPVTGNYFFQDAARTQQALKDIEEAEALSDKMSRKVNKKSTVMYESVKKEYDELMEKRSTLDEDRQMILEVIEQVEARKWASLDRMVQTASHGFSMLFSACLPGASAKLVEERNDHGHICGLQVRVAFNGKEKESLTELSGGQRSLLALCLILSILRLKPAPIYILDEVDAALDPSHTQNIGRMLQQHFSHSQFLLVSLKDGMFNYANVLFEVRNTQGFSEITRKEAKRQ